MPVLKSLRTPFPLTTVRKELLWKRGLISALLTFTLLILFEPYLMANFDIQSKLFIATGIGLVVFAYFFLAGIIFFQIYERLNGWTFMHEFYYFTLLFFSISTTLIFLANPVFKLIGEPTIHIDIEFIFTLILLTFTIGSIIYAFFRSIDFARHIIKEKTIRYDEPYEEAPAQPETISEILPVIPVMQKAPAVSQRLTFTGKNANEKLEIDLDHFIYLAAKGHYVEINYLDQDECLQKTLFRNSLGETASVVKDLPEIIQCHRSYIVNSNYVDKMLGTSRNKTLRMEKVDSSIPVSRSQIQALEEVVG